MESPTLFQAVPQAVIFDLDDTLVDSHTAFGAAVTAAISELVGRELDHDELLRLWRQDKRGHYRAYTRGEIGYDEQRRRRLDVILELIGHPPVTPEQFTAWNRTFSGQFARHWRAFDDVTPALRRLEDAGIPVGVITNGPLELQSAKLRAVGLAQLPILVSVETLGYGKPDQRVFQLGCELLDVDPAWTVYVGDELEMDGYAAQDAGLHGVWLDRPGRRKGGVHLEDRDQALEREIPVITSLVDLSWPS